MTFWKRQSKIFLRNTVKRFPKIGLSCDNRFPLAVHRLAAPSAVRTFTTFLCVSSPIFFNFFNWQSPPDQIDRFLNLHLLLIWTATFNLISFERLVSYESSLCAEPHRWALSHIEIHLFLATFKNQYLLTLNFPGESHEKGFSKDADGIASGGVL